MQRILNILRLSRPLYLLLAALTYILGAGIAHFLGKLQVPSAFWLGLLGVLFAQLSMSLLAEVFRPFNEPIVDNETPTERRLTRDAALYVSIGALTALAMIAFVLYRDHTLSTSAFLFIAVSLFVLLIYSVPPLRLIDKGFGELLLSIQIAYLSPSVAYLLQAGVYHHLVVFISTPLVLLLLAMLLDFDFPSYSGDMKYERRTLLARLEWERAIPFHHFLVLGAYVFFGAAPLFGFSLGSIWPAFLTLPFALLQVYWLRNISLGAKPLWNLLTANAIAIFGLTAYLLTLTFWLR
ncbi:MAG TPA: UbiA family prenyltransferase [Anaerolineales bacterium]|nr:UbiA family prenyltransferase [Anaerolineales bacterium]